MTSDRPSAHTGADPSASGSGELAFSAADFEALLERACDGIFVRRDDTVLYVNPTLVRWLGYESADELIGRSVLAFIHPDHHPQLHQRISSTDRGQGSEPSISVRCMRRDGSSIWLDGAGMPARFQGTWAYMVLVRDVTTQREAELALRMSRETLGARLDVQEQELARARVAAQQEADLRQRAEGQLRQAQKMDAVGRLAGGIAHDFNNILTVILAHASLLESSIEPQDPRHESARELLAAGQRAADLTRQLLALSRRQVLEPRLVDVSTLVQRMSSMLARLVGERIEIACQLSPNAPPVRIDPTQLEQVVLNLAVNARDAMPQGGRLQLETRGAQLSSASGRRLGLAAGEYVLLSVSDTGIGMDAETQTRIFEPFFTTKPAGHGVGLGLSTAHGIVLQSGGTLTVESTPGRGARFAVYLPAVSGRAALQEPRPAPGVRTGSETILVAEDEAAVRRVICDVLAGAGYRVLTGASGAEALAAASSAPGPIHLLMSDFIMPGMTGLELAQQLSQSHPKLRVLIVSGYSKHQQLPASLGFLPKPFTEDELLAKVRDILDGPAPQPEAHVPEPS